MAAATIAAGPYAFTLGSLRGRAVLLTAPADTNTWDTGLQTIHGVLISFNSADTVAADSYGYTTSGGTVTLELDGTARDVFVVAFGL